MNINKMRDLAHNIYPHYVLASHIYSQGEYNLLEILIKIPCHTFKSADYGFGFEMVVTISFDDYDTDDTFREFILDPVVYMDNLNELGALNIDSLMAHGFEMEYSY